MGQKTVAMVLITYHNPDRLSRVLENMKWSGIPDIPLYVFEDPCPHSVEKAIEYQRWNRRVCEQYGIPLNTAPKWGCMQGVTEYAMRQTTEDWIIWIPDDVQFTKGALWNEYASVLAYGKDYIGAIQFPYWNAHDLESMNVIQTKQVMFTGWQPESIPRNPHWDHYGVPRAYINVNGAGFAFSRDLWKSMGGFPADTWRIDEYLGYRAWTSGKLVITVPGQPRVHYFGGSTTNLPEGLDYHTEAAWVRALGKSVADATHEMTTIMHRLPGGDWQEMVDFFNRGGRLS